MKDWLTAALLLMLWVMMVQPAPCMVFLNVEEACVTELG